jgi:signal peptidase
MAENKTQRFNLGKLCLIPARALFCLIAIVFLVYFLFNIVSSKKVIHTFGFQHFVIQSGSMAPVLNYGDIVVVRKMNPDDLKKNDIITFYADVNYDGNKEIVTHYFDSVVTMENGEKRYRTKRAEADALDSWKVGENDLIGQYVFHIKGIGKLIMYFKSSMGIRVLILDVIILYVLFLVINEKDEDLDEEMRRGMNKEINEK